MALPNFSDEKLPPVPKGGIPLQKVPGWIRWPLRALMLPWMLLEFYMYQLAGLIIRSPYKLEGNCRKRGNCCWYILLPEDKGLFGKIYYFFQTEINGFYRRNQETYVADEGPFIVMGCRYLQKDGSCSHYRLRPMVCRSWPPIGYRGPAALIKGCGFKALPRRPRSSDPLESQKENGRG